MHEKELKDGDFCEVITGTHKGKKGTATNFNISKTGHLTVTIVQENGLCFKTLGRSIVVVTG